MSPSPNRRPKGLDVVLLALLLGGSLLQLGQLASRYSTRVSEIYHAIGQHGLWRSANFTFGQRTANFYAFLNEHVAPEASIVVPVRVQSPLPLMQQAYVEFFIQPRQLIYCEDRPAECVAQYAAVPDAAVLLVDWPALPADAAGSARLEKFDDEWALLLPVNGAPGQAWPGYSSIGEIVRSSLPALLFLAALITPASLLARRSLPHASAWLHAALGSGGVIAWLTLSLCIALLLGLPLTAGLLWSLVVAAWGLWLLVAWRLPAAAHAQTAPSRRAWLLPALLALPLGLAWVLALGNGFTETDELILWGAKGVGISVLGLSEGASLRGTLTTWYPLNVPLVVSSMLTLFGERLPASKLVFPLFLAGSAAVVYAYLRQHTQAWAAALGALLLVTTPTIFYMGTLAHANVPIMFYILAAVVLYELAYTAEPALRLRYWGWASLAVVCAAWTRPEGLHLAWALTLMALVLYCRQVRQARAQIAISLGSLLAYTLFWQWASPQIYSHAGFTDSAFATAFTQILQGDLNLYELGYIASSLVKKLLYLPEWGVLGLVMLAGLLVWAVRHPAGPRRMLWLGLALLLAVTGGFWLNTYTFYEGMDLSVWVNSSYIRLVLPGVAVLWLFLFNLLAHTLWPKDTDE